MARVRIDFNFVQSPTGNETPVLCGLWLEGWGWIVGGAYDGKLSLRTDVPLPAEVERAILGRNASIAFGAPLFEIKTNQP